KNGTWYINGKPEFYLGVWLYNRSHTDWNGKKSNPLGIKHVAYNEPPSAELFRKMGFNSSQISAAPKLQPMAVNGVPLPKNWKQEEKRNLKFFAGFKDVPMVLDFAFGYHNSYPQKKRLELDQCLGSWHQFFPFCPEHPEGDRYYTDFFLGGTRMAMRAKTNVFLYELFNESSYNCECRYNAADFAGRMQKKYTAISAANAKWGTHFPSFGDIARQTNFAQFPGLWADWCKFIGVRYGEILEKYKNVIRSADKRSNVYFTEQASGTPPGRIGFDYTIIADTLDALALEGGWRYGFNANFSAANEAEAVVATDESRHFFNCDFYQGLVQGKKPIVNNEHYCSRIENNVRVPSKREDMITSLWFEILHGVSSNFTYAWDKRSWEWKTFEQAKANVLRPSYKSSSMLNPYNWKPETLDCFKIFRSELDPYKDKILPFPRVKAPTVAVFFSYPTQRMSWHIKLNFIKELSHWYTRLLHAHYPVRVVFERDLEKLGSEVEALIFPVSQFVNPDTIRAAEKFRKRGGVVIADTRSFQTDEYGKKLGRVPDFQRAATPEEVIALLDKANVTRYARLIPESGKAFTASDVQII
ncbi:MAG: beta-galactosidase, partial [Lentisphaeria bacterium]|nr:beta-galactosidase [Lentisphaeria bacterium]